MSYVDHATDPAAWDRAIAFLRRCGDHAHAPLLEAGKAGRINLGIVTSRSESLPFGRIRKSPRPVLLLIGDDDDAACGPDGWRCALQVTRWAAGAIVHGAGAERRHYEAAVAGAISCQRFVVVDCASRYAAAWAALLGHAQTLLILPRNGGTHPVADTGATIH